MALEVPVSAVTALVTSAAREKQVYEGRGDDKKPKGRLTDAEGRPVSGVSAVVWCNPLGMLPDVTVLLPDIQAKSLVPGAIVQIDGSTVARLAGGDYAAIRSTITGERVTPLGMWADWVSSATRPAKTADRSAA